MKICALVDPIGLFDKTPEEEYKEIEKIFKEELNLKELSFQTGVMPHQLKGMSPDIYVIDYGGMSWGADDRVASIFREVVNQVEDKPNVLFVIWSRFSFEWYKTIVEEESKELAAPNVIYVPHSIDGEEWDKMRRWLGLEKACKEQVSYAFKSPTQRKGTRRSNERSGDKDE